MRLSTRFALSGAALVAVLVLLAGLLVLRLASHDLAGDRDRQLSVRLRALTPMATNYAHRLRTNQPVNASLTADRLTGVALSAEGGLQIRVPGKPALNVGGGPDSLPVSANGPTTATVAGKKWRLVTTRLGRRGMLGQLWVFEPEERLGERLALLRRSVLVTTLIALGIGSAAGFGIGRFAGRPLSRLRRQAATIDDPPTGGRRLATGSGAAEVDELARILNRLLDRRDGALETARAFAATAAHEMRTPLTSMGANLTMLEHPELQAQDQADIISDLNSEHARVQRMITILRQLALGELIDPSSFSDVDLSELLEAAVEDARRRHPEAVIGLSLGDESWVRGWPDGLRMIVDNLVDNAACHGRNHDGRARISVTLTSRDDSVILSVTDTGAGIPGGDYRAIFDRFHRRPGSPGSGLGLTLVHQQAALHGGRITITPSPEGPGTRAEVQIPRAGHPAGRLPAPSWLAPTTS